jgi:hypothetical protein
LPLKVITGLRMMLRGSLWCRDAGIGIPAGREVFEGDHTVVVHTLGPFLLARLGDEIALPRLIPRHPPRPDSIFGKLFVDVGDRTVFRQGNDLLAASKRL